MRQKSGGHSVAELGPELNPAGHLCPLGRTALIGVRHRDGCLESLHPSHVCHIRAADQGHFSMGSDISTRVAPNYDESQAIPL